MYQEVILYKREEFSVVRYSEMLLYTLAINLTRRRVYIQRERESKREPSLADPRVFPWYGGGGVCAPSRVCVPGRVDDAHP